jgi:4-hydroxyphenylacetate 3-hydroxylase, reductase component
VLKQDMNTSSHISVEIEQAFDPKEFRKALGQFATGVAIVTALDQAGKPIGMTINSFSSVSLVPPLILWSVQLDTPSGAGFRAARAFAVTILQADQEDLALKFARTSDNKFDSVETTTGWGGVPVFAQGVARFECETEAQYLAGDHEIIIGRVKAFHHEAGPALGFHQGRFLTLDA